QQTSKYSKLVRQIEKSLKERSHEPYIKHYKESYCEKYPPIWVIIEIITFGNISMIYSHLKVSIQKQIAKHFEIDHSVLAKSIHGLSELRNACAHHGRLWNRQFVNSVVIPKKYSQFPIIKNCQNEVPKHLGAFYPLVQHLLKCIDKQTKLPLKIINKMQSSLVISPADLGLTTIDGLEKYLG
ncbi:MAG: Abi family protein, partial [Lentisphaeria bacterium]